MAMILYIEGVVPQVPWAFECHNPPWSKHQVFTCINQTLIYKLFMFFIAIFFSTLISFSEFNICCFLWQFGHRATILFNTSSPPLDIHSMWWVSKYGWSFLSLKGAGWLHSWKIPLAFLFASSETYGFLDTIFVSLMYCTSLTLPID